MSNERPDPDALLAQVQDEEALARRGKLRIFFGYAAGVGKTYAMLEAAQRAKAKGRGVVVGYVEPHGRAETESLLNGLDALPPLRIEHQGVKLREFDVDAALASKPDLLLVDELAHTNAPGCRHAKRWQDVEELLTAGINVWTTLNVQHIESLNDIVGQITSVIVRETIPDQIFDQADDLELVDLTPEELADRLKAGKVYLPAQAQRAIQSFFQKSNLVALRELSLRRTAERVHLDVEAARLRQSASVPWATADRMLVCVSPSPTTSRVIRTAKRMATALNAPWIAVAVEVTGVEASIRSQERIADHFRLAENLGAETVTLAGQNVASTILDYARSRNVTKICIGKTLQPRWQRLIFGTVVDEVLEQSGSIDVYVIHGQDEPAPRSLTLSKAQPRDSRPYAFSLAIVAICGLVCQLFFRLKMAEANLVMVFLAGVSLVAYWFGRGPAIVASIASVLMLDFLFVPPYLTFAVTNNRDNATN